MTEKLQNKIEDLESDVEILMSNNKNLRNRLYSCLQDKEGNRYEGCNGNDSVQNYLSKHECEDCEGKPNVRNKDNHCKCSECKEALGWIRKIKNLPWTIGAILFTADALYLAINGAAKLQVLDCTHFSVGCFQNVFSIVTIPILAFMLLCLIYTVWNEDCD